MLLSLTLQTFSVLVLINSITPISSSTISRSGDESAMVMPAKSAILRFFDCENTPVSGSALSPDQSLRSVLTDKNLDTAIMGRAIFDVSTVNSSIVNGPGPELMVVELHNPERINFSIPNFVTDGPKALVMKPIPMRDTYNSCGYPANQASVDLSIFGIPAGSAIPSVRINNLGMPDSLVGSDIAEVLVLPPNAPVSESDAQAAPSFRN